MQQWLITVTPKGRYAGALHTFALVINAQSKAEALRSLQGRGMWQFEPSPEYNKPKARPLPLGLPFNI
jgi:hypothetical protein